MSVAAYPGKKRVPLAVFAVSSVLLGGLTACGAPENADAGDDLQHVELVLSYQRSIPFIGEILAQENGYFAEEGLDVEPVASDGGTFVVQQLIANNIPFGLANTEATSVAASNGYELEAVSEHDRDIILIGAPEGSGVTSVTDLEGETLGITDPGGGEIGLVNAVLRSEGLTDKVEILAVGPGGPAVYKALSDGDIAAYSGFTNDLVAVEAAGMSLINILPEEFEGLPSNSFVMSAEATDEERDIFIRIIRAWNRGTVDALNDPERALEVACDYVPEECADMDLARAYLEVTLHGVQPREDKQIGEFDYESLELQATALAVESLGDEEIDFETVFSNKAIDATNDFDTPDLDLD